MAAEIRRAITEGDAGPGQRLPLAKDMAAVLGVNKITVLRALYLLRDEGLLEFRRGRGITAAGTPEQGVVVRQVQNLIELCRTKGNRRGASFRHAERLHGNDSSMAHNAARVSSSQSAPIMPA
ncbi:MAG: GntR family transcriptional regulator [Acidimicrobiales bacterium]